MFLLYIIIKSESSHFLANYKQNINIFTHMVIYILNHRLLPRFMHDLYTEIKI